MKRTMIFLATVLAATVLSACSDDRDQPAASAEQGATTELYLYPGADHTFVGDDWELAMSRSLAFFDRYVKNGGR